MGSTIQTSIAKAADLATDAAECQSCHSRIDTKLCPTEVDNYSGYGFAFPACNASTKTTIQGLIEFLIHHHGIPGNIFSDQGPHFTAREVQQWAHDHGIHVSRHPEATRRIERWNGLLNTQQCQLGGSSLDGWTGFSRGSICFESVSNMRYGFSHARIHRSRNQGVEKGRGPLSPLVTH